MRAQPDIEKEFILITDASEVGIAAILAQKDEFGNEKVVYAFSKILDDTQKRYSTTDKELLAVVKGIENFRRFLIGKNLCYERTINPLNIYGPARILTQEC